MSDPRGNDSSAAGRIALVLEFLRASREDLARVRGLVPQLESGDSEAWTRACTLAHNLAAGSNAHKLGVLTACARELEQLLCEKPAGEKPGAFLMHCVASGIETVALEVETRIRDS